MRLSRRLEAIVEAAFRWTAAQEETDRSGLCAADVGTDHGFVPICLIERGIVGRALALDVREGPLLRAREHVRERGLQEKIGLRLGDGLEPLEPGEAQLVILTGMGGELMLRILKEGEAVRRTVRGWILSPQSELALFRHGLEEMGLAICDEVMLEEEGKYYTVITAEPGRMHYEAEYLYRYGEVLLRKGSEVLSAYLEREIRKLQGIRERLLQNRDPENPMAKLRLQEVEQELAEAEKAISWKTTGRITESIQDRRESV